VVALQALAEFASLTVVPSGDSSGLQLTAAYGDKVHRFDTITRQNALLLQTVQVSIIITTNHHDIRNFIEQMFFCNPVSEMTYAVSSGMLNSTIPYHTL